MLDNEAIHSNLSSISPTPRRSDGTPAPHEFSLFVVNVPDGHGKAALLPVRQRHLQRQLLLLLLLLGQRKEAGLRRGYLSRPPRSHRQRGSRRRQQWCVVVVVLGADARPAQGDETCLQRRARDRRRLDAAVRPVGRWRVVVERLLLERD